MPYVVVCDTKMLFYGIILLEFFFFLRVEAVYNTVSNLACN